MGDGRLVPIERVYTYEQVISVDSCNCIGMSTINATFPNGVRRVLRVHLHSGRYVDCTENHPLLTIFGWQEAQNLAVGDHVGVARKLPIPSPGKPLPQGFAALLGYLVGDGSFGKGEPIVTTTEPAVVEHLENIARAHGWFLYRDGTRHAYHIRGKLLGIHGASSCKALLRSYMVAAKSRDKRVPPCIFTAGEADLRAFLAAYFNCDATVSTRDRLAEFYSVSEGLLRDIQHLLTRLSIWSTLRAKRGRYRGEVHYSWRLTVDRSQVVALADSLPVLGQRGDKLRSVAEQNRSQTHYPEWDAIPPDFRSLLEKYSSTKSVYALRKLHGIHVHKKYTRGVARQTVLRAAEALDSDPLRALCSPDVAWDRIVEIEDRGEQETFGIEVEATHAYLNSEIFSHNSESATVRYPIHRIQQDPALRVIVGAYNQRLASSFSRKARRVAVQVGIPFAADRKATEDWETEEGGGLRAVGVGSGVTGAGGHLIVIDDPVKSRQEAESQSYRDRVWDWYRDDLYTRLEPKGAMVLIQTRWHVDDLAGRILASEDGPNWTVLRLPALAEEGDPLGRPVGAALCPDRYDETALAKIRTVLGSRSFAALYQGSPRAAEGGAIKTAFIQYVDAVPRAATRIRYWDKAATERGKGGDASAGVLMARDDKGLFYVEDVVVGQWSALERDQVIRQTAERDRQRYGGEVSIWGEQEPGSGGKESAEAMVRLLAGHPIATERSTGSKEVRAQPFAAQCEAGNVKMLRGPWNADYISELSMFPMGDHDDQVDASSGAFNKLAESYSLILW